MTKENTPDLVSCQHCNGTGFLENDEKCDTCCGTGLVSEGEPGSEQYEEYEDYIFQNSNSIWYFVCSIHDRGAIHVEQDFTIREKAVNRANKLFEHGVIIEGDVVEFDQVVCISEHHEICFHVTKANID